MVKFAYVLAACTLFFQLHTRAQKKAPAKLNASAATSRLQPASGKPFVLYGAVNAPLIQQRPTAFCDTIILTRQSEIDSFNILYPGCTNVKKLRIDALNAPGPITRLDSLRNITTVQDLELSYTSVNNLSAFSNLTIITGWLFFDHDNTVSSLSLPPVSYIGLIILDHLPNLTSIAGLTTGFTGNGSGTLVVNNTGLQDLTGLENIHLIPNMYITGNHHLQSLQGLHNLTECNYGISLWGNDSLTNISAFSNITQLSGGTLEFSYNQLLNDISGFASITYIENGFWVEGNGNLTSLAALNDNLVIQNTNGDDLRIEHNTQLSVCSEPAICNFISLNPGDVFIVNNASGCNDISEIESNCNTCANAQTITWEGTISSDWNDTGNWSSNTVPGICDTVYIPSGSNYYPTLNQPVTIHGLIMDSGAELYLNSHSLSNYGVANINGAAIFDGNMTFHNSSYVDIQSNTFYGNVTFTNYTGTINFSSNNVNGNLVVEDNPIREAITTITENDIYGNLFVTANTDNVNAQTHVTGGIDGYVHGNVTLRALHPVLFEAGGDGHLRLSGNLRVQSDIPGFPNLGEIHFFGDGESRITQLGTAPLTIHTIYPRKNWFSHYIIPEQDVYVSSHVEFLGGVIKTEAGKMLIFNDDAYINQYSSGSWVWGPVKKIGNDEFLFPTGDTLHQSVIRMSAPSATTDSVTAIYYGLNATTNGYDTAQHVSSLTRISGKEYWTMQYAEGPSAGAVNNIRITLSYDSVRSQKVSSLYSLRVSSWNGSQWVNDGSLNPDGNLSQAFIATPGAISNFGVFTFGLIEPARIPIITVGTIDTAICRGQGTLRIPFAVDTLMYTNNLFTAQLSDATGSFAAPTNIGFRSATQSDTINAFIPGSTAPSDLYRIRVIGSIPPDTSTNTQPIKIKAIPLLPFTIQGPDPGCISMGIHKYYVSDREPGVNYTWNVPSGGTFTSNADTVYVTWTTPGSRQVTVQSSNSCGNGPFQSKTVTVSYPAPVSTPLLIKEGRWLYASTPDAAQHSLGYHWYRNNVLISGAANASYYASLAGTYTVKYYNLCGESPASNQITFAANAIAQSINFSTISSKSYGEPPFVIDATATSGLPVSLAIISGPGSLSGNTYTITATGTVTIRAIQRGDDVYDTAAPVFQSFDVVKGAQSITFPAIPDQLAGAAPVVLNATASSGLPVSYSVVSGPATLSGNNLLLTGIGIVTVSASQSGNQHYLAATPVQTSFCVRVAALNSISGPLFVCPGQTANYSINNISGLTYSWRLADGGSFPSTTNTVAVSWPSSGTYTLIVSATGPCGPPTANDSLTVTVVNAVAPGVVSNMLPANGSAGLQLPLSLSWIPGDNALTYDLYVWDSAAPQPSTPFASDLVAVSYVIPNGALVYNKTYKWRLVTKNACLQVDGPVQHFRLKPLPDLFVTNVQAPTTAFSGQTITINWTVGNTGPGHTATNQSWTDAVFLSFDQAPNFTIPPNVSPVVWNQLNFPLRPLLIGTRPNISALDSGQQYSNSINFTLPVNYSQPLYVYVITHYPAGSDPLQQMTVLNDTASASQPIAVTLSPTPDLRVDTVFTTASTFSGSPVNVTYKVKNYGALTPVGSYWTDNIYISQSPFFNSSNATPLKKVKSNGSYYPNASNATIPNTTQLQHDSMYTRNIDVVIPNFISGAWFIYVHTNYENTLYEGALADNNATGSQVQVFLTPTPQLTVSSLNVPVTAASTTQPIGVNWNTFNAGFRDNIEKNKGHYYVPGIACATGTQYHDSLGFGSSYWIDRAYLSTNAASLDTATARLVGEMPHGMPGSGYGVSDDLISSLCLAPGINAATYDLNTSNVIVPGANYPVAYNFTIPADLPAGDYYVYVLANATQTVFEYPGTPQTRRSALPISIQRPDVTVASVNVPANSTGGQPISIQYSVSNIGSASVFNHLRKDRIYASSSPVFDTSAQLIATQTYTEDIPAGSAVAHAVNYTFPAGTSGMRYIYVRANFDSTFRETNYTNNTSTAAATSVTAAIPNDLVVSSFQLADTVWTIYPAAIKYTVSNIGSVAATGNWTDSLFISCTPAYSQATSYYIAHRTHNGGLAIGANYSDSFTVSMWFSFLINNCFPQTMHAPAYFFIKTNADQAVYEGSNDNNNVLSSGSRVVKNPLVDHIVTSVNAGDTATVARPYPVNWIVKNIGYHPGNQHYNPWYDAAYFSPDSVFNSNAVAATSHVLGTTLQNNQSYSQNRSIIPPNIPTGDYYVWIRTNSEGNLRGEKELSNNTNLLRDTNGAAKKIHVVQPLLPDLANTIVAAPSLAAIGQPLTIVHRVQNNGAGETFPSGWSDDIWLSTDLIPGNSGDIKLAGRNHSGILQPGQSYNDTVTASLSMTITPGNYILLAKTNSTRNVIESNDTNNIAQRFITIYAPAPSDLLVTSISAPDTVYLGYTIDTAKWVVTNNSSNSATGISSDGIYLSKTPVLDSTALLLGVVNKDLSMGPLDKDTIMLRPLVNSAIEGSYHVLVKTDLLNNIVETNKDNNVGIAAGSIYVKVKELPLNIPENHTLHATNRYYKLIIPDSLRGSTILVTLKTNDSLTMRNEMFIGLGYVPSAAQFDYRFETANYGNQQSVMAAVEDSVYYITVRCVSSNPIVQNITLKAVKLPFAILTVQSGSGGNTGNVTVKINGSLFTPGMTARLSRPGTTIDASTVFYTNSTIVFATFNLQGRPLGSYDVSLSKADTSTATLLNGFTIVNPNNGGLITGGGINTGPSGSGNDPGCDPGAASGLNSQLVAELVIPEKVFGGWPFTIQINYANPANVDVPAQIRILYNDKGVPMAIMPAGIANGTHLLYLELSEPGGPPGIIRAGGSGTITVYAQPPLSIPGHTFVNFFLK